MRDTWYGWALISFQLNELDRNENTTLHYNQKINIITETIAPTQPTTTNNNSRKIKGSYRLTGLISYTSLFYVQTSPFPSLPWLSCIQVEPT